MTIPPPIARGVDLAFRVAAVIICLSPLLLPSSATGPQPLAAASVLVLAGLYVLLATLFGGDGRTRDVLGYLDSLAVGMALLLLPLSLLAVVALAMLVTLRATTLGGFTLLCGHVSLMMAGALVALALFQPALSPFARGADLLPVVVALPAMAFIAWRLYHRQQQLVAAAQQLHTGNLQLKLNNYKLAKYLSPSLRKAIFSGKRVALETQRKRVSVFFSDIKGFSELSEQLEADTLTIMLNFYLTEMSDIALKFGATVDKFIGDAVMVFFGDPTTRGAREDAIACVSMAIAMQKRMDDLNKRWAAQGIRKPLHVRMGINTGFCAVGNFGTENRMDYTLLGTEVNKASRLEAAASAGEILISRPTYELVKDTILCEPRGPVRLKGIREPVEVFSVVDLRANIGREDARCLEHSTEGFSMFLDVDSVPHLQKHRILASLEEAQDQLRKDIEFNTRDDIKIFK